MAQELYATGHRKNAIAKVWLIPGEGRITVNGLPLADYVRRPTLELMVKEPLQLAQVAHAYDVRATCLGGGIAGQAGALRHGCLLYTSPSPRD